MSLRQNRFGEGVAGRPAQRERAEVPRVPPHPVLEVPLRAIDRHIPRKDKWRDRLRDELVARF